LSVLVNIDQPKYVMNNFCYCLKICKTKNLHLRSILDPRDKKL